MNKLSTFRGRPVREMRRAGRTVRYVADQLVVKLKSRYQDDVQARKNLLRVLPRHSRVQREFDELGTAVITIPETADPFKVASRLKKQQAVEFAEPLFLDSGS